MIYFAQPVDGGPIKIGYTDQVNVRLKRLERHYEVPLVLLATKPGDRKRESEIHQKFSHLRIGRSEQFRPSRGLMNFIGKSLPAGEEPGPVEKMGDKVFLNIEVDAELRHDIRVEALRRRMTVVEWFDKVVREHLREEMAKKGLVRQPIPSQ